MRRLALLGAALAGLALLPSAGAAVDVRLRAVDTEGYPTVRATVVTSEPVSSPPALRENGQRVPVVRAQNLGRSKSVVLAVDRSQSMAGRPIGDASDAARAFVLAKPRPDRIAVVAVASRALQLTRFSSATIDADAALRTIEVDRVYGTALHDAVVLSSRRLAVEPAGGRVLVLVTDGQETTSSASLDEAIRSARAAGVAVYAIGIESHDFRPDPLRRLAAETGGTYYGASSTAALAAIYRRIAGELSRTWQVEYVTAARPGERARLAVSAGGSSAAADVAFPGRYEGSSEGGSSILPTGGGGAALLALAIALLVFAAVALAITVPREQVLKERLAPHLGAAKRGRRRARRGDRLAVFTALFRATESAFGHLKHWRSIHRLLERADLPLRTVEFVYVLAGSALVLGLLAAIAALPPLGIVAAFAAGAFLPYGFVWFKARRRVSAFEDQLPDLLVTLAASLKAGHSFRHGIQTVVDEGRPPASKEFKRVLSETTLGRPMDDALHEMSERIGSKNFEFVITAVTIQRQVGGSLAGLFDMVAETVRQRQQFERKLRSLTAMGKMSAYVLIGLPFFLAFAVTLLNREYMDPLYHTSTGHKLIAGGLLMMGFGTLLLKKIVSFKG
jgi:tight adherence protein B